MFEQALQKLSDENKQLRQQLAAHQNTTSELEQAKAKAEVELKQLESALKE